MPDWSRTNFTKLRDVSPSDVPIQWRFARDALESPELGVSRFTFWDCDRGRLLSVGCTIGRRGHPGVAGS
jgi:hypothetical protein